MVADGSLLRYDRDGDANIWGGLVTSLGCHGVVTSLTLDLVPDYDIHNYGYSRVPAEHFLAHWDEMLRHPACDSFNAMLHHPMEFVSFGLQSFVPTGSVDDGCEAPDVEPQWHGEGVRARRGNFGPFQTHGESGNNIVRWHSSLTWLGDAKEEEFQVEYFVALERAPEALRAAWAMAAEHWGEVVEPDSASVPGLPDGSGQRVGGTVMNYNHIRVVMSDTQVVLIFEMMNVVLKTMNFVLTTIKLVLTMIIFVFKMMNYLLKMMNYVLKTMNFAFIKT